VIHPRTGDDAASFAETITDLVTGYLTRERRGSA
jgi:hypothetical protein